MTAYRQGDVLLVPYPFTDQSGSKQRPTGGVARPRSGASACPVRPNPRPAVGIYSCNSSQRVRLPFPLRGGAGGRVRQKQGYKLCAST